MYAFCVLRVAKLILPDTHSYEVNDDEPLRVDFMRIRSFARHSLAMIVKTFGWRFRAAVRATPDAFTFWLRIGTGVGKRPRGRGTIAALDQTPGCC